jgi:transcriptional regulator with XRE-family HTH domain
MPRRSTPHPLAASVGQRIRALRDEKGLTIHDLAEQSAIRAPYLSSIEDGLVVIHLGTARKIAQALDVKLLDLLTFPEQDDRQRLVDAMRKASPHEMALLKTRIERVSPRRALHRPNPGGTRMKRGVGLRREAHHTSTLTAATRCTAT